VVWGLWLAPPFFNPSVGSYSNVPLVLCLAFLILWAILIAWVFNSARVSVLNASSSLWRSVPAYGAMDVTAAAVRTHVYLIQAVVVVLVCGPRDLSRRSTGEG
jgi:hypothetical protein